MTMIIVQIPHQHPAIAFCAESFAEIVNRVGEKSVAPDIVVWTAAQLTETFGDDVEHILGQTCMAILARDGRIVEVSLSEVKSDWMAEADAPSLDDVVKEWLSADMSSLHILENPEEAQSFIKSWAGHGWMSARPAARREAERLGWLLESE